MTSTPDKHKRLFVALFPGSEERKQLHSLSLPHSLKNSTRSVPVSDLHITLKFLGSTDESAETCLVERLSRIRANVVSLELDHLEYRKRQHMLWAIPASVPQSLESLVLSVEQATAECGFEKSEYRFTPHITLARKVSALASRIEIENLQVKFREFCLVKSDTGPNGSEYTILRTWPLGA